MLADVGLDVPAVFNKEDLGAGDRWAVVYRVEEDGERELLPYHGLEGEQLAWVSYVDLLYFGNSVGWRRMFASPDVETFFGSDGFGYRWLVDLALFDHGRRGALRSNYDIECFASRGTNRTLPPDERFAKTLFRSMRIHRAGAGSTAVCQ